MLYYGRYKIIKIMSYFINFLRMVKAIVSITYYGMSYVYIVIKTKNWYSEEASNQTKVPDCTKDYSLLIRAAEVSLNCIPQH
jgi:hypothetical protein